MASPAVNDDVADSRISRTEGGRSATHQFDKEWAERSAQHGTSGGGSKALGEKITAWSKQRGERGGVGGGTQPWCALGGRRGSGSRHRPRTAGGRWHTADACVA
jgi:hypothetical protein